MTHTHTHTHTHAHTHAHTFSHPEEIEEDGRHKSSIVERLVDEILASYFLNGRHRAQVIRPAQISAHAAVHGRTIDTHKRYT
jgi:hypothetical protein